MLARKIAILAAAATVLGSSIPAFASPPGWAPAHGYRQHVHGPRMVAVVPATVFAYRLAPVAMYRAPVRYAPPPPAYGVYPVAYPAAYPVAYPAVYPNRAAGGAFAGAVAGAIIGGSLSRGEQQFPAIAIGTVLGAVIGHEIAGGY